jgi:hypothetical protein
MRLISIRAKKGLDLNGPVVNGSQGSLRLNTLSHPGEDFYKTGWQLHLRGPLLLFESPAAAGKRRVFMQPVTDFDLGFELDEGEQIESFARWDSYAPAEAKGAKK